MPDDQMPDDPPIQNAAGDSYLPWMPAQPQVGDATGSLSPAPIEPNANLDLAPALPMEPPPTEPVNNPSVPDTTTLPTDSSPAPEQNMPLTPPSEPVTEPALDQSNPLVAAALSNQESATPQAQGVAEQVMPLAENTPPADASNLPNWDSYSQQWINPDGSTTADSQSPQPITAGESSTPGDGVVAPDEVSGQKKSKAMHIILSLLIVVMVISGASAASYIYVNKGVSFIKLPKLPFIQEPESSVELVTEEPTIPEELPEEEPIIDDTEIVNPIPPQDETEIVEPVDDVSPGESITVTVPSDWRTFTSKKWGYTFKYPLPWEIYPRDTGAVGETTMVASQPLSSLEGDIRILPVDTKSIVIGVGMLAYPEGDDLTAFLKQNSTTYQLSQLETKTINNRVFVTSLTVDGKVLYYFTKEPGSKMIHFVAVKPASYDSQYADQVQRVVGSLSIQSISG